MIRSVCLPLHHVLQALERAVEAHCNRVVADVQIFGDLGVLESRAVSQREDVLIRLAQHLTSVEQPLNALLFDDAFFGRRHVGNQIGNPVERHVQRASALEGPQVVGHGVASDPQQPGARRRTRRIVPIERPQSLHEDVRGHVLGGFARGYAEAYAAKDRALVLTKPGPEVVSKC